MTNNDNLTNKDIKKVCGVLNEYISSEKYKVRIAIHNGLIKFQLPQRWMYDPPEWWEQNRNAKGDKND